MERMSYGKVLQRSADDPTSKCLEEILELGYSVVPGVYTAAELSSWRERIDEVYSRQESTFGRNTLEAMQDADVARALLLYDDEFLSMAIDPRILPVLTKILGEWFILHLQNGIINRPGEAHHQRLWHRDLPYQNFTISRPLAVSVLIVIDDFSVETGGTEVLPASHRSEFLASEPYIDAHMVAVTAPSGSALVFDSMLFHRAGLNRARTVRRAVNHVYTTPLIKQQYDFPRSLDRKGRDADSFSPQIARILGFTSQVPLDDKAWRIERTKRRIAT
jgi:ectoine hydroxylase-related dioxygenase (phytanoyl-CoA dioxygenase family)